MGEYIFDPPEATVLEYLEGVQSVEVVVTIPDPIPDQLVQLEATGSTEGVVSERQMVTFICWGSSRADAADLAEDIRAHMRGCRQLGGLPVYKVRQIGGPVYRPDPDTKRDRYQFTLEFNVRGRNFSPSP